MKRLILSIILILFSTSIFCAWGSSVKAVYKLENNVADDTGNGYGGVTVTSNVFTTTQKYEGSYSINHQGGNGYLLLPDTLKDFLKENGACQRVIEFRIRPVANELASLMGNNGTVNQVTQFACYTYQNNFHVRFSNLTILNAGALNNGQWNRVTVQYGSDGYNRNLKIYVNGNQTYASGGGNPQTNPFYSSNTPLQFLRALSNQYGLTGYMDYVIITDTYTDGVEIQPLADTTNTITPTITQTSTQTVTETITQTITETITPTITQTSTITTTITRTATATATTTRRPYPSITPTRTMTPRGTPKAIWTYKSPTPTRTPYIRVLSTPRARYATVTPTPTKYWW